MKMNYRLIRSARGKGRFTLLFPIMCIGMLALFHFFYPSVLARLFTRLAAPLWSLEREVLDTTHRLLALFSSKQSLLEDVERLSARLEEADRLLLDRELLLAEHRLLTEALGRIPAKERRILGNILSSPPRSPYDTVIIDIGERDGVLPGDLALSGSALIGRVSKARSRAATVELFSTAGKNTSVSILHDGQAIPAEAVGMGGGVFLATLPREVAVNVGDEIIMPPRTLLIFARVEAVEGSATDSFQKIYFKNPVSLQSLRFLEIKKDLLEE